MKINITPVFDNTTPAVPKVSAEYNLALQQARIHDMPMELRVRMGQLMLKGWVFKLAGCELIEDGTAMGNFIDHWEACKTGASSLMPTTTGSLKQVLARIEEFEVRNDR